MRRAYTRPGLLQVLGGFERHLENCRGKVLAQCFLLAGGRYGYTYEVQGYRCS